MFAKRIEYILEWNLLEKSVKRYLLYFLQVYLIYLRYLLGTGTSLNRKFKIDVKRKSNYEIGWFHN